MLHPALAPLQLVRMVPVGYRAGRVFLVVLGLVVSLASPVWTAVVVSLGNRARGESPGKMVWTEHLEWMARTVCPGLRCVCMYVYVCVCVCVYVRSRVLHVTFLTTREKVMFNFFRHFLTISTQHRVFTASCILLLVICTLFSPEGCAWCPRYEGRTGTKGRNHK